VLLEGLVIGSWPTVPGPAERSNLRDLEMLAARPLLGALPAGAPSAPDFLEVARASLCPQLGGSWDPRAFRARWDP
jgi:dethiobiotin synthetase